MPVGLLRAQGQVVEVGVAELAMDQTEGRALLDATGVALSDADVMELVGRTEGWPVGLYLAALACRAAGQRGDGGFAFTGDDRFIADYLGSELLAQLPPELVAFLTRTAVLERMSGPLCDAVLDTRESGRVLESLEDSNLLVVPLDRRREWYRYHQLFRELLRADLERREPELVPQLHPGRPPGARPTASRRLPSTMPRPPATPTWWPGWCGTRRHGPMPAGAATPRSGGTTGSRTRG